MGSKKIINVKENTIGNFSTNINSGKVTINYAAPKKMKPSYIWFQMKDPLTTFSGRAEQLKLIDGNLKEFKSCVVSGFAGMGKTELARYYAWTYSEYFSKNIVWINAEDSDSLKESFKKLATELDVLVYWNGLAREDNSIVQEIYSYFKNEKCLFIFDNVSSRETIDNYLPSKVLNENIYILITSQNIEWGYMKMIHLQKLPESEAIDLLVLSLKRVLDTEQVQNDIAELAKHMQYIPLALQQAASYIEDKNICQKVSFSIRDYIESFKKEESLLGFKFPHYSEHRYRKSVSINISLILKKLSEENAPLAIEILYLVAYFAPDEIDKNIFEPLVPTTDQELIDDAFRTLMKYSLVSKDNGLDEYNIHRLVQLVVRQHLKKLEIEKEILTKGLDLILVESKKCSMHSSYLLKYAYEEKILFDYYKNCANKMLFWYDVVHMTSPDIALCMLPIITNPRYFYGQDIINAAIESKSIKLVQLLMERGASVNAPSYAGGTPLPYAIADGNLSMVKFLVAQGADLNYQDDVERIPLTWAIEAQQVEIVKYLIDAGTNLFSPNAGLLHAAARCGRLDLIQMLLDKGMDINTTHRVKSNSIFSKKFPEVCPPYKEPETPLDSAASYGHLNVVKFLLNRGARPQRKETIYDIFNRDQAHVLRYLIKTGIYNPADIPWQDIFLFKVLFDKKKVVECFFEFCPFKEKVLGHAALNGWVDGLMFLVEKGVTLGEDFNGGTLFHLAIIEKNLEVLRYLESTNIDINHMDKDGRTALAYAVKLGDYDVVAELCKAGADPNVYEILENSPIYLGIAHKHMNIVEYLIQAGARLTDRCLHGDSLLSVAAHLGLLDLVCLLNEKGLPVCDTNEEGSTPLHEAAYNNHPYVVNFLIKNGAKVNQEDKQGYTPLFHACSHGHFEAAEALIQHGSDVNHINQSEKITPLVQACRGGETKIVSLLIDRGADVNFITDIGGNSAFYAAVEGHVEVLDVLRKAGVDFHRKSNEGVTVLQCAMFGGHQEATKYLINNGMDINEKCSGGFTYLTRASQVNNIEMVQLILSLGVSVNDPDIHGLTALQVAASMGHTDMVKFLVNQGANLDLEDLDGNTALHQACYLNHLNIVSFLCYKGADINKYNSTRSTALHLAVEQGHLAVVDLLVEAHANKNIKNDAGLTPEELAKQLDLKDVLESLRELKM